MDPQLYDELYDEVSQNRARFMAANRRNDYNTCRNLVLQIKQLKDKMKAEIDKASMPNNGARELERMANFGFFTVTMSYAVLYFLYAAFLGKEHPRVMVGLHIWTVFLILLTMLQVLIGFFVQYRFGTMKVVRLVMSLLIFMSSFFVFILLQLGL